MVLAMSRPEKHKTAEKLEMLADKHTAILYARKYHAIFYVILDLWFLLLLFRNVFPEESKKILFDRLNGRNCSVFISTETLCKEQRLIQRSF